MKALLFALLVFIVAPLQAQTLLSGFLSKHSSGEWCEANYGVGYRQDSGEWAGWAVGVYKNSLCKTSFYVAREWLYQVAGPLHLGVLAGAVTGYQYAVVPIVLPEAVVKIKPVEFALVLQPFNVPQSPAFIALQLRYTWK